MKPVGDPPAKSAAPAAPAAPADVSPEPKTSSRSAVYFGLFLFALLFVIGGGWLYFAQLSGAVIAIGNVAVKGKPKTVQHLNGGIVTSILVADGDRVERGQILLRLDPTMLKASLNISEKRIQEAVAQKARLVAERDGLDSIVWDEELLDLLKVPVNNSIKRGQQRLFEVRRKATLGQINQLTSQIAQFENQVEGIVAVRASKSSQISYLDSELKGVRYLRELGLANNARLLGLERQREALIGEIAQQEAQTSQLQNALAETRIKILQIEREFSQSVLTDMRDIELLINETAQEYYATSDQLKRIDLKAPIEGIIHDLKVFTIGGVIGPGEPILQIVPQDDRFEVEAKLEPQFIDSIYADQSVKLRFSAFNQSTTPELEGKVIGRSANVITDTNTGATFYRIIIHVSNQQLILLSGQELVPGMPVEAYFLTKNRSPLNYLIKPLSDSFQRAFREE